MNYPSTIRACGALALLLFCANVCALPRQTAAANQPSAAANDTGKDASAKEEPGIQDNSFLIEEAYNQEYGIVQHIQTFQRFWNSHSWGYSYTNEWPINPAPRHQFSYTLPVMNFADGAGTGLGDVALNYRYQLIGNGEATVAFSPRFTLLLPTGDYRAGRGAGAVGYQGMLPVSWIHNKRFTTHWNLGTTITPSQKNPFGETAATFGVNAGQSVVFNAGKRLNFLLETVWASTESVVAPGKTDRGNAVYMNPAVRWAYNLKNGTQIVPGIGVPVGVGPSSGDWGIFVYFSVEHPFTKSRKGR